MRDVHIHFDAHKQSDVGANIRELEKILESLQ